MEQNYKNLLGVYTIQVKIDLETFWLLDDYRKKKMVIDTIYKGIQEVSKDVSFELNNIMNACLGQLVQLSENTVTLLDKSGKEIAQIHT